MKYGDVQKGLPEILYKDTKANIEALVGVVEGATAYATDTDEPGWYNGAAWAWGAGGGGGNVATDPIWDAIGDLAAGTGANTAAKVTVGADGTYLKADSGQATGLSWDNTAGTGDVTYAALLASQLVNEIKGWPPIIQPDVDLDALNLWWDKVGTPTTAPSVVDVAGEGITEDYELCLKVVADAASEGLYQRFTYADEPRVKAGRRLSTLWAIWCVGGVGATLSIINQTAEETAAAKVTAAAWTIVEVPNHLCAGTYVDIKIIADGAGTFYAVPLGANIGARGFPLAPRSSRWVDGISNTIVNGVDPAGSAGIDVDCTAITSNLCNAVELQLIYKNATTATKHLYVRRNGETVWRMVLLGSAINAYDNSYSLCPVDDGQIFEYKTDAVAGDSEVVYITVNGWWEWE